MFFPALVIFDMCSVRRHKGPFSSLSVFIVATILVQQTGMSVAQNMPHLYELRQGSGALINESHVFLIHLQVITIVSFFAWRQSFNQTQPLGSCIVERGIINMRLMPWG